MKRLFTIAAALLPLAVCAAQPNPQGTVPIQIGDTQNTAVAFENLPDGSVYDLIELKNGGSLFLYNGQATFCNRKPTAADACTTLPLSPDTTGEHDSAGIVWDGGK